MPLKVCLYIPAILPGGGSRQIVNLARELSMRGMNVILLHAQKDSPKVSYLDAIRGSGVEVVNVFAPAFLKEGILASKRHNQFFHGIPAPQKPKMGILFLSGALCHLKPNIIHSYCDGPNCDAGCAAVLAAGPVHLASFRNIDPKTGGFFWEKASFYLYKYLIAHAHSHFEANSQAGVRCYAHWLGIDATRISYNPNGIDPSVYMRVTPDVVQAVRQSSGIPASAPVLLTLARYSPEKAPGAMLDIFARVHAAWPKSHYLIAGLRMTDDDEMGEKVRERGLAGHVHLLGVRSDVAALLASADVFLLPSWAEGIPNALMEAMAAAVPVVASNVGGVPDLVRHGIDGFLHGAGNVDGMAESVNMLLGDAGLRTRLGDAAQQRILAEFTLQKLGDRVVSRYHQLLGDAVHSVYEGSG